MLYVELSELEPQDQDKIRSFLRYRRQAKSNYVTNHPWIGGRIWRPVDKVAWMGKLIMEPWEDLLIQKSETHTGSAAQILRARRRPDGIWVANDADSCGMVCLCFDPIPADWTYFEIQKVHFLESSLVVKPAAGDRQELFRMF